MTDKEEGAPDQGKRPPNKPTSASSHGNGKSSTGHGNSFDPDDLMALFEQAKLEEQGATPRWVNFIERPSEPLFVDVLRSDLPSYLKDSHYAAVTDDQWVWFALCSLNQVDTPAELEMFYRELRPYVAHMPKYLAVLDEVNDGMWHYFLGGHS